MNRTFARSLVYPMITTLSLLAAFAAHAESPTAAEYMPATWSTSTTRAQRIDEFLEARRTKAPNVMSTQYNPALYMKVMTTREAVKADVVALVRNRHLNDMTGEDSGSAVLAQAYGARNAPALLAQR